MVFNIFSVFRYNIKPDARDSLYDAANEWMDVVGKKAFLGGEKPNLADLVRQCQIKLVHFLSILVDSYMNRFNKIKARIVDIIHN